MASCAVEQVQFRRCRKEAGPHRCAAAKILSGVDAAAVLRGRADGHGGGGGAGQVELDAVRREDHRGGRRGGHQGRRGGRVRQDVRRQGHEGGQATDHLSVGQRNPRSTGESSGTRLHMVLLVPGPGASHGAHGRLHHLRRPDGLMAPRTCPRSGSGTRHLPLCSLAKLMTRGCWTGATGVSPAGTLPLLPSPPPRQHRHTRTLQQQRPVQAVLCLPPSQQPNQRHMHVQLEQEKGGKEQG